MRQTTGTERPSHALFPYLLVALAAACWSGNHVVGRALAGHAPPFAIATIRWALPTLAVLPFAIPELRRDWPTVRARLPMMLFLAATGGAIFGTGQYVGLKYTTAINVSVLNSLAPILIATAGGLIFRDRFTLVQMAGLAVSLTGVLSIVTKGDPARLAALEFNLGDLVIIANMGVWGIYSASLRHRPPMHWKSFIVVFGALSALMTLPFFVMEHRSGDTVEATLPTAAALIFIAVFPSLVAYLAWNRGVELIGANRAGPLLHLIAVYSSVFASIFLGEALMSFHFIGFALILAGVWLAARPT